MRKAMRRVAAAGLVMFGVTATHGCRTNSDSGSGVKDVPVDASAPATASDGTGSDNTSGALACKDVSNGCPAGQSVQTTGCMQPHFITSTGQTATFGRCVQGGGPPPGALGMPLNPETCQNMAQLHCPSDMTPSTSGCNSPHFVTGNGHTVTYGHCIRGGGMPPGALGLPAHGGGIPPGALGMPSHAGNCSTSIRAGAFNQWRADGGSDNDPQVSVKAQADGTYAVSISGAETGEFDYIVTVSTATDNCVVTNWAQQARP